MAQYFDSTQANDLLKKRYADKVGDLVPESAIIHNRVPFSKAQQIGQFFSYSIQPTAEQGFTYGGNAAQVYSLNTPISGVVTEAQINGFEMTNRAQLAYGLIEKSLSGEASYQNALDNRVKNLIKSHMKREEIAFRYGQQGLGDTTATTNVNPTTEDLVFSTGSWAGGFWAGTEGAELDVFNTGTTTQLNTTQAVVITMVDFENRTIRITGAAADITAIGADETVTVYFRGAAINGGGFNEMIGLDKIMTTTSGSIFNVNVGTYRLWRGNTYSAGSAPLSLLKITKALEVPMFCGMEDMSVIALCSPKAWADLANDEAALRRYPTAEKKGERGYDKLTFHYSGNKIEVYADPLTKNGDCFIFPVEETKRVGAVEIKMQDISGKGDYYAPVPNANGLEIRSYSNQGIFFNTPAQTVKITNIVPAA